MGKRGGPAPAAISSVLVAIVVLGGGRIGAGPAAPFPPLPGRPPSPPERVVTVLALADAGLRTAEVWKIDITHTLMHVSQTIEETSGIKLKIKAYGYWSPGPGAPGGPATRAVKPLAPLLSEFRTHLTHAGRGSCDIVIALVPEDPDEPIMGIADYLGGIVLMKYFQLKGNMEYVLLHELCHLFGAVDVSEEHSVMSRKNPSFKIDGFTSAIMSINRQRSFRPGEFPLPRERILQAIALYEKRQSLGWNENELAICLRVLRSMIDNRRLTPR